MKYNININQKAVIDNGFNLDLVDCAIIDYIAGFANTGKMLKTYIEWVEYFWIQYEHLIKEMPLLWIKTREWLRVRLRNLESEGVLDKKIVHGNSTYFKFGSRYELLIADTIAPTKIVTPQWDLEGGSNENWRGAPTKIGGINNNTMNPPINDSEIDISQEVTPSEESVTTEEVATQNTKKWNRDEAMKKIEEVISQKKQKLTKQEQARLVFYFIEKLRKKRSVDLDFYVWGIQKLIEQGFSVEQLVKAAWNLQHNKFASWENDRWWSWDYKFFFRRGTVDEALTGRYKLQKSPNQESLELLKSMSFLFANPKEEYATTEQREGISTEDFRKAQLRKLEESLGAGSVNGL